MDYRVGDRFFIPRFGGRCRSNYAEVSSFNPDGDVSLVLDEPIEVDGELTHDC